MTRILELQLQHVDINKVAEELYDPGKPGGLSLPGVIPAAFCTAVLDNIRDGPFVHVANQHHSVEEEFDNFYVGEYDADPHPLHRMRALHCLKAQVSTLHRKILEGVGVPNAAVNSACIHRYRAGAIGISAHRDYSSNVNLISVAVLAGEAPFTLLSDRTTPIGTLDNSAGSLILMRAPRPGDTQDLRPYHSVGPVLSERYSVCFRERREPA